MFDKRLTQLCPESKKYIIGNIVLQWLELALNTVMIITVAKTISKLYYKEWSMNDEVIAACKKASIHDFLMTLPNGYDTQVGELGETLSGGERQRIGLARAFLHDAPFMLLDEPTSNLDSLNEAVILRSLKEEAAGKTVVLVSHRASTIRIADESYSVENGRLS